MIKAILLIFEPMATWGRIVAAQKRFPHVLVLFFLPVVLISVGGEVAGLYFWGRHQEVEGVAIKTNLPEKRIVVYGVSEVVLSLAAACAGALLVKAVSETFQKRNSFDRCFALVAYALSPLFLVHLADANPSMNPWVTFAVGMMLCVATLYHGVPRMLQPEPVHAFGVYVVSAVLLTGLAGLARFLSWLILTGKIKIS